MAGFSDASASAARGLPTHPLGSMGVLAAGLSGNKYTYDHLDDELRGVRLEFSTMSSAFNSPDAKKVFDTLLLERLNNFEGRIALLETRAQDMVQDAASIEELKATVASLERELARVGAHSEHAVSQATVVVQNTGILAGIFRTLTGGATAASAAATRAATATTTTVEQAGQSGTVDELTSSRKADDAAQISVAAISDLEGDIARASGGLDQLVESVSDLQQETQRIQRSTETAQDTGRTLAEQVAEETESIDVLWHAAFDGWSSQGDFGEDGNEMKYTFGPSKSTWAQAPEGLGVRDITDEKINEIIKFTQERAEENDAYRPLIRMWTSFRTLRAGKPRISGGTFFEKEIFSTFITALVYIDYSVTYSVHTGTRLTYKKEVEKIEEEAIQAPPDAIFEGRFVLTRNKKFLVESTET